MSPPTGGLVLSLVLGLVLVLWLASCGGGFEKRKESLDDPRSAALLADRDLSGGDGEGALQPSTKMISMAVGGLAGLLALSLWLVARRRSPDAAAAFIYRRLIEIEPWKIPAYISRQVTELPTERAYLVLDRLAVRLSRDQGDPRAVLEPVTRASADLLAALVQAEAKLDTAAREGLAEAFEAREREAQKVAREAAGGGAFAGSEVSFRTAAVRDCLFAAFLRAESLGHLTALHADLLQIKRWTDDLKRRPSHYPDLFGELAYILGLLAQLGQLPGFEDRAMILGQALSETLKAQERLQAKAADQPTSGMRVGLVVFESLRHLLTLAMEEIHQRAELSVRLRSRVLATQREAVVILEIENIGQGHARNLSVELMPGKEFVGLRQHQEVRSLLRNQSARLEFLVEPKVSDRVRLRFRICYDDLERKGRCQEFAELVEFRRLTSRRVFTPLSPNPYVVGRPLSDSDPFFGREEIFARLESSLVGAHQDNVVVLMGPRRMGKTSILRRLHHYLGEDYVPVLIDLQGMIGSGQRAFFRELTAALSDGMEELGIEVDEPPAEAFERDPGSTFRRRFLRDARRALDGRRLLLLLDEFEVLEERIRSGDLQPRILAFFRSLMQHERSVSFIFAGTHRLEDLTRDYWGVLFNLAVYLEVGHLSREEVGRLFVEPTEERFEIDSLALDKVWQLTGGHPHFSQLVARELVEQRNRRQLCYLTVQDVNAVAEQVVQKGQLHIGYLWDEASRSERLLLLATRELLARQGLATLGAAHRFLVEKGLDAGNLPVALRQLTRKEILSENAGLVSFRMELLRLWLGSQPTSPESFLMTESRRT